MLMCAIRVCVAHADYSRMGALAYTWYPSEFMGVFLYLAFRGILDEIYLHCASRTGAKFSEKSRAITITAFSRSRDREKLHVYFPEVYYYYLKASIQFPSRNGII